MDNIISWNIRGLNDPNKQEDVSIFLKKQKVGLIGLRETKVRRHNEDRVASTLFRGWQWKTNGSCCLKGRIWVAWRPKQYNVSILKITEQLICYQVTQLAGQKKFFLTYVYGYN